MKNNIRRAHQSIVFVNRYFYPDESATSALLSDLAFCLAQKNHSVKVFSSKGSYVCSEQNLAGRESVRGVAVTRVSSTNLGRLNLLGRFVDHLSFHASVFFALLLGLKKGDCLVALTDPPLLGVTAAMAAGLKGAELVHWVHDLFPETAQALGVKGVRGPLATLLRSMRNTALKSARLNIALDQPMKDKLVEEKIPASKIVVIHNWADGEKIRPMKKPGNLFVVAYSGNLGRIYDFQTVLDCAERLKNEDSVSFVFIGSGPKLNALKNEVERRRLKNVSFRPYAAAGELSQSLSTGDLYLVPVLPSLNGLVSPSKFYSILAAGRPVFYVGPKHSFIAETVKEEGVGMAFENQDAAALAAAILELSRSPEKLREMGERARALFDEKFDRPIALKKWTDFLKV